MQPTTTDHHTVTLSSKYQLVVPPEIRRSRGWKPGDEIRFVDEGETVRVVRVPTFQELRGILKDVKTVPFVRDKEYE